MKKILYGSFWLVSMLISYSGHSQEELCPDKGITTDPRNPVNDEEPEKINDFFDWETDYWPGNFFGVGDVTLSSPFDPTVNANLNLYPLQVSPNLPKGDFKPSEGWELIDLNIGLNEDGNTNQPPNLNYNGTFILYNKYQSILRLFVVGDEIGTPFQNSMKITMTVVNPGGTQGCQSSLLQPAGNFTGLDKHWSGQTASVLNTYENSGYNNWQYADFYIHYDPCVCLYDSFIDFEIKMIEEAEIILEGSINGFLGNVANVGSAGNGTDKSFSGVLDFQDLENAASKTTKRYKSINEFSSMQLKYADVLGIDPAKLTTKQEKFKDDMNKFNTWVGDALNSSKFLKFGMKAAPFIGGALELIDFFTSGTQSPPPPQAINLQASLAGSITAETVRESWTLRTPSSIYSSISDDFYPYYNNPIGVFNILSAPTVRFKKNITQLSQQTYDESYDLWVSPIYVTENFYTTFSQYRYDFSFELDGELDYFVNPSSGFETENVDITGAIMFEHDGFVREYEIPSEYQSVIDNSPYTEDEFLFKQRQDTRMQTGMFPLNCLYNITNEFSYEFNAHDYRYHRVNKSQGNTIWDVSLKSPTQSQIDGSTVRKAYLKLFVSLKRKDNGESFLHVLSYPLEITEDLSMPTRPLSSAEAQIIFENSSGTLDDDVTARYITIDNTIITNTSSETLINGIVEVSLDGDSEITGDVFLYNGPETGCYALPEVPPAALNEIAAFCTNPKYQGDRQGPPQRVAAPGSDLNLDTEEIIDIYPNPTTGLVNISLGEDFDLTSASVEVLSHLGSVITSSKIRSKEFEVNLEELSSGIYFIRVTNSKTGFIGIEKVVKN